MKHLFVLLAVALIGAPVLAHEEPPPPNEVVPAPIENQILGEWKTERPTRINPYAVAYGEVFFTEGSVVYKSICSYHNGPVVEAVVEAPVDYHDDSFRILESKREITYDGHYSCEAYVSEGRIHYKLRHGKLYLANYPTGWRMTLIR